MGLSGSDLKALVGQQPEREAGIAAPTTPSSVPTEPITGAGLKALVAQQPTEQTTQPNAPGFRMPTMEEQFFPGQRLATEAGIKQASRRAEITGALAEGEFDPDNSFGSTVGDFFLQADIARSTDPVEMRQKFLETYPLGNILVIGTEGGDTVVARKSSEEPFREFGTAPHAFGVLASEPVAAGVAGARFGILGSLIGAAAGVVAKEAIETARGFSTATAREVATEATREGLLAGAIDVATRGLIRAFGFVRGGRGAVDLIGASERQGLEPLAVGQVGGPFSRGLFRQVGVTSGRIEEKVTKQERSLLDNFERNIEKLGFEGVSDERLMDVMHAQQKSLNKILSKGSLTRAEAGTALQKGIELWRDTSREVVDRAYSGALSLTDDVTFDLKPAKRAASEIRRRIGVLTTDKRGRVIELPETLTRPLIEVVDTITRMNPVVANTAGRTRSFPAFEQMKALRSRLFDLKNSGNPRIRDEAGQLWEAVAEVMQTPRSGNPKFLAAYRTASARHWQRETMLDRSFVGQILRSDTPERIVSKFVQPNNSTALKELKRLVPENNWDDFRQLAKLDIMREETADAGVRRLDRFVAEDPAGLRLLMSKAEERQLRFYLAAKKRIESSPIAEALEQNLELWERGVRLARRGSAKDVADAVRFAGGPDSAMASSMKAGIYKDILDKSTVTSRTGERVLDARKLVSAIEDWQQAGKLDTLFKAADWERIRDVQRYAAVLTEAADVGGGMMGGAIRAQAAKAPTEVFRAGGPARIFLNLVRPIWANNVTASILSRPAAHQVMSREAELTAQKLRQAAIAAAVAVDQSTSQQAALAGE